MQRPKLTCSVVGVALTLCACTLDTKGLGGDAGRTPVFVDTGIDSRPMPGSGGAGGSAGSGGSGGEATGGVGMAGSGGEVPDAGGGSGGAGEDAAGGDPDAAGGSGGAPDVGGSDVASDGSIGVGGSGGTVVIDASQDRVVSAVGCADGTREGFISLNRYAGIAACTGAWTEPGLVTPQSYLPQCAHKAGNTGSIANGMGCSAADLCAAGWHVCESAEEVRKHTDDCDDAVEPSNSRPIFFATRQTASSTSCNATGTSSIMGCGNIGARVSTTACGPLNARLGAPACFENPPWQCGDDEVSTDTELRLVTKPGLLRGGVLCCRG